MNPLDLALAILFLLAVAAGWRRGLIAAGAELIALLTGVVCAFSFYPYAVGLLDRHVAPFGVWAAPLALVVVFVLVRVGAGLVLFGLVRMIPAEVHNRRSNHAFGILPGAVNGLIDAMMVSLFLLAVPLTNDLTRIVKESVVVNRLAPPTEWAEAKLRPVLDPAIDDMLSRLIVVEPESHEAIKLPFTVQSPPPRPDLEAQMLVMVNAEREKHGLRALEADADATAVARAHSVDMFAHGYFSHITPQGDGPFDRMRRGGLRFRAAGENLALARNLPMAHRGLMESPGHRANILQPGFGRVGIGIVDGGRYGVMVTQTFRN